MNHEILQLNDIIIENSLNPREGALDQEVILDYAAHVDDLPAMHVFQPPQDNRFYLVSGFHRIAAHRLAGRTAAAFVVHVGTLEEAREFADLDNLKHGLRLSRSERRKVIERQLKRHPEWSDTRLANACYTTDKTVRVVREELEAKSEIPRLDILTGSDGIDRPRTIAPRQASPPEADERQATLESAALPAPASLQPAEEVEAERYTIINDPAAGPAPWEAKPQEAEDAKPELEQPAVELSSSAPPPPPPPVEAPPAPAAPPPPPPVVSEPIWHVSISLRPGGPPPLVMVTCGQEPRQAMPAQVGEAVIELIRARMETPPVVIVPASVPVAAPEWLIAK